MKSKSFTDLIGYYRNQIDKERQDLKSQVENEIVRRIVSREVPKTNKSNFSATACMVYHLAGFVSFKRKLFTKCDKCLDLLCDKTVSPEVSSLTGIKDMGGLSRPSTPLFSLLNDNIEPVIQRFKVEEIGAHNVILKILENLHEISCDRLGCSEEHSQKLATEIILYYITIRMYFLSKHHNKESLTSVTKSKQIFEEAKLI